MNDKLRSGLTRAARTFLQAALAQIALAPLVDVNLPTLKVAAFAGGAAVLSLVQRWLDGTPIGIIPPG